MMKKVIIIDDSITQLNFLKVFFANNYWEVYSTQSAQAAYEMIFDIAPDLIITDAIMPKMGGFQLIKQIRENPLISKIPTIVYSILDSVNAKFYIKEHYGEFYLQKSDNLQELLNLANVAVNNFAIDSSYKAQILQNPIEKKPVEILEEIEKQQEIKPITENIFIEINEEDLASKLKEIYNFSLSDEKLLEDFFKILYPILKYDLFMVGIYSFEEEQKKIFFDIKDIILSPIFQNTILKKYNAQKLYFYKKYAPNLKMITNENEFNSKIELNFIYKNNEIANIAFWSKEKDKYDSLEIEILKKQLEKFFQARYINKSSQNPKTTQNNSYSHFSFLPFLNIFNNSLNKNLKQEIYIAIIQITNFARLKETNTDEALDVLNLKISDKIITCLDVDEQIDKYNNDEYILALLGKDEKQIYNKMNYIINNINSLKDENENNIEAIISASNCMINNEFNAYEARKTALKALELIDKNEKVIIK